MRYGNPIFGGKSTNFGRKKLSFSSKNKKKNIGASQTSFSKPFLGSRMVFETIFIFFFFFMHYSIAWPVNEMISKSTSAARGFETKKWVEII